MRARLVLGWLRTIIWREGEDNKVSASFYMEVVQAILLHGSEMCVLSASMEKRIEDTHTEFLKMIMGKRAKQLIYGTWVTPGA